MGWKIRRLAEPYEKDFSLGELLDAIGQGGLPQAFGGFWKSRTGSQILDFTSNPEIASACAIGQGALNIGASYLALEQALHRFRNTKHIGLDESIMARNDNHRWSPQKIAQYYRESFREGLNVRVPVKISYEVTK